MNPITTFLRPFGNDRAVANARSMLDARRREEWLVQNLERRLRRAPAPATDAPRVREVRSAA